MCFFPTEDLLTQEQITQPSTLTFKRPTIRSTANQWLTYLRNHTLTTICLKRLGRSRWFQVRPRNVRAPSACPRPLPRAPDRTCASAATPWSPAASFLLSGLLRSPWPAKSVWRPPTLIWRRRGPRIKPAFHAGVIIRKCPVLVPVLGIIARKPPPLVSVTITVGRGSWERHVWRSLAEANERSLPGSVDPLMLGQGAS